MSTEKEESREVTKRRQGRSTYYSFAYTAVTTDHEEEQEETVKKKRTKEGQERLII